MMPRIDAEERLEAVTVAALGAGNLPRHDAGRAIAALERRARPGPAPCADARVLAMMGIEVVERPPRNRET